MKGNKRYKRESKNALCPFYKYEFTGEGRVVCEGIPETKTLSVSFKNVEASSLYRQAKCYGDYQKCRVYQMLMRGYEDGK